MSNVFKERYKLPELIALVETKQEQLKKLDEESRLLRNELILLMDELSRRSNALIV